jgi:serine/threonine-protein kinase
MVDLFQTASADLPRDERPTPQQLVEEAAKRARDDPDLVPEVRANLLFTLGKVALANGDYKQAELMLNEAIGRYRALGVSTSSIEWIDLLVAKGNLLQRTDRNSEADQLMADIKPQLLEQESEPAVSGLMLLGATRASAGHIDEAVTIAQQAARKAEKVFGADSINAIETLTYLGQLCDQLHRYRESVALLEPAVARWRRLKLPQDEEFARTLLHLAKAKELVGDNATVEPLYLEAIALMRRVFDKPHDRLASALGGYARFLTDRDRFGEAQSALDEALAIDRKVLGEEHVRTALLQDAMAMLDHARHDDAAAEHFADEATRVLSAHAKEAGFEEESVLARLHLADVLMGVNRLDAASAQLDSIAAVVPRRFGNVSAENADFIRANGRLALARNDAAASLALAQRGTAIIAQLNLPATETRIALLRVHAEASAALGKTDAALTDVAQALDALRAAHPEAHVQRTSLLALEARLQSAAGHSDAATAAIVEAQSLGVPAALLSHDDAVALNPNGI